ncbi:MAG: methyltransferase domain-containing protein [Pirellulales bacterium]
MNWKLKAAIQNIIAQLPEVIGNQLYFQVQYHFGNLRRIRPIGTALAGLQTCEHIISCGHEVKGATFFEVGTGRMLTIPIIYWLAGADRTFTVDLHHYLRPNLVKEAIKKLVTSREELFSKHSTIIDKGRWKKLCELDGTIELSEILKVCHIDYSAPTDATNVDVDNHTIDFHTSHTVLEHIPPKDLLDILKEEKRVLKTNGLFVHHVDYSDHFSHSDNSINPLNFLKYNDTEWQRLAGNRFMYMNRLRHVDYLRLLKITNLSVIKEVPVINQEMVNFVNENKSLFDEQFSCYSDQDLAPIGGWLIAKP